MTTVRRFLPFLVLLTIAGALIYAGWFTLNPPSETRCSECGRPVHLASRVDANVGGEQHSFCCAACALRARPQDGTMVQVTRLYDYESGKAISADDAVVVVGSTVNLCMREHVMLDSNREPTPLHFDRCAPSVLAFANAPAAERFRAEHGGAVQSFAEAAASFD